MGIRYRGCVVECSPEPFALSVACASKRVEATSPNPSTSALRAYAQGERLFLYSPRQGQVAFLGTRSR